MRKVTAAIPRTRRTAAVERAGRILVQRDGFRAPPSEPPDDAAEERLAVVRSAVFAGHRLEIDYAARDQPPSLRTIDPVGLVSAAGQWYLLATRDGAGRTYRMSRLRAARELDETAERPADVDLERLWQERRARFVAEVVFPVRVRIRAKRRADLVRRARAVTAERVDGAGRLLVELGFAGVEHAEVILWGLGPDVEAIDPPQLRERLATRAAVTPAHDAR